MQEIVDFLYGHALFTKIAGIIILTLVLIYIEKRSFRKFYPRLLKSKRIWDDAVLYAIHFPLKIYIFSTGAAFAVAAIVPIYRAEILAAHKVSAVALFIWSLARFIQQFENNYATPEKLGKHDPTTITGLIQVFKAVVFTIGSLTLIQFMGIPLSGVIAFGGVGGIAVGFAAKDLLANFFGGLMIFLDRPFKIGDWIRSPDKEIEGTVEHIGWRLTRIRTFDRRPLFVPNSVFSTISLENPSRMSNRRIKARFGLSYEDSMKISAILDDIETMIKNHPAIDQTKVTYVKLVDFGPYSLQTEVYTFTKTTDWVTFQSIQQDVFLKILNVIHGHGTRCAYPITSLEIPGSPKNVWATGEIESE